MKAYLIIMHLLVPRSRSSAKVKVKYKGYIPQKMAVSGTFVLHKHILFVVCKCCQFGSVDNFCLVTSEGWSCPEFFSKVDFSDQDQTYCTLHVLWF